jgi:hypothetical protein
VKVLPVGSSVPGRYICRREIWTRLPCISERARPVIDDFHQQSWEELEDRKGKKKKRKVSKSQATDTTTPRMSETGNSVSLFKTLLFFWGGGDFIFFWLLIWIFLAYEIRLNYYIIHTYIHPYIIFLLSSFFTFFFSEKGREKNK